MSAFNTVSAGSLRRRSPPLTCRVPHSAVHLLAIAPLRKIPCALALVAVAALAGAAGAAGRGTADAAPAGSSGAAGPGSAAAPEDASLLTSQGGAHRIEAARLFQSGRMLVLTVRTARPVPLGELWARPNTRRSGARYLCLGLSRPGHRGGRRLCLGGRKPHRRLGAVTVNARGKPVRTGWVRAQVKRPAPRKLVVALAPERARMSPQRYRWRLLQSPGCRSGERCAQAMPARGVRAFRLRPVRAVGCSGGHAGLVTHGSRERPLVALTFDDGPSDYTAGFLEVLREKDVPATFYVVGRQIPGSEETLRRMLAEGHEIGDHTTDHVELPGYSQIAGTRSRIRAATHFEPCTFRPPGGAVSSAVISTAGALGMTTVNWDVDPFDWRNPGSGAVYSRVVEATRSGSIVVMHDGGGPRGGTLAALPRIVDTLRARGYRFATVSELLGHRLLYRPYG